MESSKVEKIIEEIKAGRDADALDSFDAFLAGIPINSSYSSWPEKWVERIYEFGALFVHKSPESYFSRLENFLIENESKKEVIDFIYSEIAWNYFSNDKTYVRDQLKDLKKKYPLNPEFYHSYSHVLYNDGNLKESLEVVEQAIRIDSCERFVKTYINRVRDVFNKHITRNHIRDAELVLNNARITFKSMPNRKQYVVYTNLLPQLQDRLDDHKIIQEKISKIDGIIIKRTEALRNRFISMLGVFAAIIAFILTTVNIAISNLNLKDTMLLMLSMASVLLIFVLSIDYVFYVRRNKRSFFEFMGDKQFWAIILLLALLYWLFKMV